MTTRLPNIHHLNLLCRHITEKTGIGFDEKKQKHLEEMVEGRCQALGVHDMGGYLARLRTPFEGTSEFSTLMDILTIQESFFFRQNAQFHALRHFCLPRLMEKKESSHQKINIWSAGCACGEEAYSIAMVIRDLFPENPEAAFYIRGTDISRQALHKAKEGIYPKRAVRNLASRYLDRYFTEAQGRYILRGNIKRMVDFECLNLSEAPFPFQAMPRWDIVFCRNVIIYFTTKHSRKLLKNFFGAMAKGGFLFAGFSETMGYLNEDFMPIRLDKAFVYQKPFTDLAPKPFRSLPTKTSKKHTLPLKGKKPQHFEKKSLKMEKTRPALRKQDTLNRPESLSKRLGSARELADKGDTVGAAEVLDSVIKEDPLHTRAYFLLAMIHRDKRNLDQSERYLKRVIYLEPDNPLARLHLADIYKAQAREPDAVREYTNVISLLESRKNLNGDLWDDGFTGETILTAARAHLRILEESTS